jgi:Protein of unknown function (DUF732)
MSLRPASAGLRAVAILAAAGAVALGTAGMATAGPLDDAFIADLQAHGIYFDSPAWALNQAFYVCQEFDNGRSYPAILSEGVAQSTLNGDEVAYFIDSAVMTYCPGNSFSLPG